MYNVYGTGTVNTCCNVYVSFHGNFPSLDYQGKPNITFYTCTPLNKINLRNTCRTPKIRTKIKTNNDNGSCKWKENGNENHADQY